MASSGKVAIVGGGAAGLMAAIRASELGAEAIILEKMRRPARKILISGKGRCNVTTGHDIKKTIELFGKNGPFLHSAFAKFFAPELIELLATRGVELKLERGKRYFPVSDSASDIANALIGMAEQNGCRILPDHKVVEIATSDGRLDGVVVEVDGNERRIGADAAILATGGMSYPASGSSGDGYRLAAAVGHKIVAPLPALIPIELKGSRHKELSPLSYKNVSAAVTMNGKVLQEEFGEMMFTPFGITGPIALELGKTAACSAAQSRLSLIVNYKPALSREQVDDRLQRDLRGGGKKLLKTVLEQIMPTRAVPVFMAMAAIPDTRKASETNKTERLKLVDLLVAMEFQIKGTRPIEEAIVTAGGVDIKEVNPRTMESKLVKGLYICGELLDIDGPTGGFNLQAAFSTGRLAGESAASDFR